MPEIVHTEAVVVANETSKPEEADAEPAMSTFDVKWSTSSSEEKEMVWLDRTNSRIADE